MSQKSKRELWRDLETLRDAVIETSVEVASHVERVTDADGSVEVPEEATVLETESDVVTVWMEPES